MRPDTLPETVPDAHLLEKFQDGSMNILFVGWFRAGHNEPASLLAEFDHYRTAYNRRSRLFIVLPTAAEGLGLLNEIKARVRRRHLQANVYLPERTGPEQLKAFYLLSHAFLCVSGDDTVKSSLLHAVRFEVPIVAWASAPVRHLLGDGLLAWEDPKPGLLAASLHYCLANRDVGRWLVQQQLAQAARWCRSSGSWAMAGTGSNQLNWGKARP